MNKSVLIDLQNITLVRGGKTVLKNISWKVKQGENWFILGRNGSGKTSLLEIVLGYLWATKGKVAVLGQVYGKTDLPALRKRIGYVAPWIYKRIKSNETVREVVAGGLEASIEFYKEMTPQRSLKIKRALQSMECLNLESRVFTTLSSGEQLKVMIARALISSPLALILDEPFSALDMGFRHSILQLLNKMGRRIQKPSIILVTHHFDDITPLYSHGLLLKAGKIVSQGPKKGILTASRLSRTFGTRIQPPAK